MPSSKLRLAVLPIAMLSLTGCPAVNSDTTTCPPIVTYSQPDQTRAAAEIYLLPESSVVVRMLQDYAALRDEIRACR